MAAGIGRVTTLTWNGVAIGGVQEKGVKFNGEVIDISSDDDAGWRKLIEDAVGQASVDIDVSGVTKSGTLRAASLTAPGSAGRAGTMVITYAEGSTLTSTAMLASYSEGDPVKGARTYQASFQSSGTVTYVAA